MNNEKTLAKYFNIKYNLYHLDIRKTTQLTDSLPSAQYKTIGPIGFDMFT